MSRAGVRACIGSCRGHRAYEKLWRAIWVVARTSVRAKGADYHDGSAKEFEWRLTYATESRLGSGRAAEVLCKNGGH